MRDAIAVLACFCLLGCSPPLVRGDFTLLTIEPLGNSLIILSQAPVKGRACFNVVKTAVFIGENVFDAAVVDALAKHEGATVLANAEFVDDGSCVEVSGLPARF
jgi:hypothetical protein